ncbi:GMC oxidoreductase [Atractiella rhizophila]|nr:GMC oxidoreductase [Atractiella rhizophila]
MQINPPEEADIVVAGCGTSACVLISRLAAANPDISIVAIEAGPANISQDAHIPANLWRNVFPPSTLVKNVFSQPMEELNGKPTFNTWGHGVGGSSQINFMCYARGNKGDFNAWGKEAEGWDYEGLLPYLRKIENHYLPGKEDVHGYDGPLHVSNPEPAPVSKEWINAGVALGLEHKEDVMDFNSVNAIGPFAKWINGATGHRSLLAANTVLALKPNIYDPITDKSSLRPDAKVHIIAQARVTKVLLSDDATPVAKGLEYVKEDGSKGVVRARKLVVLSAGALNSPLILERSGIGKKEVLSRAGVESRVELDVGTDLQDHPLCHQMYHLSDEADTRDPFLWEQPDVVAAAGAAFEKNGGGPLGTTAFDGYANGFPSSIRLPFMANFASSTLEQLSKGETTTDKVTTNVVQGSGYVGDLTGVEFGKYFWLATFLSHALSKGHIHITSADIDAPPDYKAPFLTNDADVHSFLWTYKATRESARRMPSYRGELGTHHPVFSSTSNARAQKYATWDANSVTTLNYSEEDDKAIENWVRDKVVTTWHTLATTPMKFRQNGGVVDANLSVYGVKNLKVADLGIAPSNLSGNTYHAALAIGEKAASIFAKEVGLSV